jgi:hypothetical protein
MSIEINKSGQDDRLLDYLDGRLEGPFLEQLRKDLENSEDLRKRLEEFRLVHRTLAITQLEAPSQAFVNKVMQNLHRTSYSPSLSPRNGILLLAGMMVASGLLVVMISAGIFDQFSGFISLQKVAPVQKYLQQSLPVISVNGKLLINFMVGINLILGFIILDRTVLKPFFQKRSGLML